MVSYSENNILAGLLIAGSRFFSPSFQISCGNYHSMDRIRHIPNESSGSEFEQHTETSSNSHHFTCECDCIHQDQGRPRPMSSCPIYEELICEIEDEDIIHLDDPIDLCDETDEEVVEVGVNIPASQPVHSPISPLHILPFRLHPPSSADGITSGVIHVPFMPFGGDPDIDSIFARIQQHLRSQAAILGHVGLFGAEIPPRIPPERVLDKLATRRISCAVEAQSLGSCPICLDPYRARMLVRVLPGCGHLVHKGCMDKWIVKSRRFTCPLDNIPINVEDVVNRESPLDPHRGPETARNVATSQYGTGIRRSMRRRRSPRH